MGRRLRVIGYNWFNSNTCHRQVIPGRHLPIYLFEEGMQRKDLRAGDVVLDRWFYEWGFGRILEVLKTRVKINFASKGLVVYDIPHLKFLERPA